MDDLIKAVKSLISDIESMSDPTTHLTGWYGPFSEYEMEDDDDAMCIEWPNLAISVAKVKELLEPTTIEGELTKSMIAKQAFVGQGMPIKDMPLVESDANDLKGLPFVKADFGEIETRYLAQNAQAARTLQIYQRKLIDRGFTIKGDLIVPPIGMGQFAFDEITEQLMKEAKEEASKPELKVVK